MAEIELWAGDRALAGAVFLIAVPEPGWRRRSLGVGRGRTSRNAVHLVTAGRFSPGFLQPFVQLPLGVISLKKSKKNRETNINQSNGPQSNLCL